MTSGVRSALALLALASTLAFGQGWNLDALMSEMAAVPASRARFVETRHLAMLTQPLELKGSLSYERPNRLVKHVETPFDASNDPVAFNDAGNVLTFAPGAYAGARYRLSLSGPAASAACPGTAANSSSADSNGCQVAPTGRASWWPKTRAALWVWGR